MHSHDCAGHASSVYSVHQSLDELEFERGIWGAAIDGDIEKVKKLINKVDPSIPDSSGYTALHYTARNGKYEVCKFILEKGANPNAQTNGGATPLHRAAYIGNIKIVSLLLHHKADPSIADSDGKTPLHKAAEGQHCEVVEKLVNFNPQLKHIKDNKGHTASSYFKDLQRIKDILS